MTIFLGILNILLTFWPVVLGTLALIFHNWTTAKIIAPLLNIFWGQAFIMLAIVVLVMNLFYFIRAMVANSYKSKK